MKIYFYFRIVVWLIHVESWLRRLSVWVCYRRKMLAIRAIERSGVSLARKRAALDILASEREVI
jgi:hypothetical protein